MVRHSVTSKNTKKMLADVMKKLLEEKDFSKITIADIVARAGVNRKTFYYHFKSTDALLAWIFEQETVNVVKGFNSSSDLEIAINFILDYIEAHHQLLRSLVSSIGRGPVHKFLCTNIHPQISAQIDYIREKYPDSYADIEDDYRDYLAEFYTEAVAGMLENWIEKPVLKNRQQIVRFTMRLFNSNLLD
ncbi:TetR/AcrR family transcriptional regulator C-terminal domain-containing protein [Candidatus Saccharibacteria bacterium]|nr:TetR/AcrR family transcriptional regulator C-terminal domain-containing protein [Candidatus Saccharibacteria bacterium]